MDQWRLKKRLEQLDSMRGADTSMISLIVSPKDQIAHVGKMLRDEYRTAENIKSRVNRLSVLSAITTAINQLKRLSVVPITGLALYVGNVEDKKVIEIIEPPRPINTSLYKCDERFHTEPLRELLETQSTFGYIVLDGNGCLFGTVTGTTHKTLHTFSVNLPKKHKKGGQSAARFGRQRVEKRNNYIRKVAEIATNLFLGEHPIEGLVLAGASRFKNDLLESGIFDSRLKQIVIKLVDVSYGGTNGFHEAIEKTSDDLINVKLKREKDVLTSYMQEISKVSGKYCFGPDNTVDALEMGAVDTLIVWDDLDLIRYDLVHQETKEHVVRIASPDTTFLNHEIQSQENLVEWLITNINGATLEFVSDQSSSGSQFVKGFGGLGGILRFSVDFE